MAGERRDVLIIFVFGLAFFVLGNWVLSVTSLDEGRNLDATRRMLETGDFLVPHYNCRLRFEKPPLLYWTTALWFFLLGPGTFSGRLVSGLSAIALSWATYRIARDFFAPDRALASALVLMTLPHLWVEARAAVPELLMTACMAWGLYALLRARWGLGGLALGLAFLAKGPVGVVLPVGVYLLWRRDLRWLNLRSLAAFGAVGLPWYGLMVGRFGFDYFYKFFIYENLFRYTGVYRVHLYPFYYYVPIVLISSLFYLPALPRLVRTFRRPMGPLLGWFLFVLAFFSLSRSKLHHYILFAYPPLAILWAHATSDRYRQAATAAAALLLTALLIGAYRYEQRRFVPVAAALIRSARPPNVYFYKTEESAVVYYTRRCIPDLPTPAQARPGDWVILERPYLKDFPHHRRLAEGREFEGDYLLIAVTPESIRSVREDDGSSSRRNQDRPSGRVPFSRQMR